MQNKVSILIIEDEGIVALELQESLHNEGYNVIGVVDNGLEAVEFIKKNDVEIILLDINIKGSWDGIETALQIKKHKDVPFIYLTAYADGKIFERAKLTLPSAYLTKPYQLNDLRKAIDLAMYHYACQKQISNVNLNPVNKKDVIERESILYMNDAVFIKQNYKYNKITYENILYLKADGNYTYIHTLDKKYIIKYSLQSVIDVFNTDRFVRIHRSYAINVGHIASFNETMVLLRNDEIPIGRNYKDVFMKLFKQL